jgi:hypothetical protein
VVLLNSFRREESVLKKRVEDFPGPAKPFRRLIRNFYLAEDLRLAEDHGTQSRSDLQQVANRIPTLMSVEQRKKIGAISRNEPGDRISIDPSLFRCGIDLDPIACAQNHRFRQVQPVDGVRG